MSRQIHIGDMTWVEYERRIEEDTAVVIVPIGSTEQHGPHTPLGCDAIVGAEIADAVAERIGALVAPQIAFGYKSQPRTGAGNHFPGNICLDGETITLLIRDVLKAFARHGVTRLCVLSSHYENHWFVGEGIQDALEACRASGVNGVKIANIAYYELASEDTIDAVFGNDFPGWEVEHGAIMTTSVLLHRRPDLVDMSKAPDHEPIRLPPYDVYPFDPDRGSRSGALSASTTASAAKGKLFFDDFVSRISAALTAEFGLTG